MQTQITDDPLVKTGLRTLTSVLSRFRSEDAEMPIQQMVVLLWVASNEGKTQRELRASLDMASSTSSRNLAALSKVHRLGKEGLGLIDFIDDPLDRRAKQLWLTPKGRAFINEITGFL